MMLHLARHGHHAEVGHILSGRSDISLDPLGRAEAERLARRLAAVPLRAIHASPRRRTRETAEIVAAPHRLPVQIEEGLDEIDFGSWAGRRFDDLAADPAWQIWNARRATATTPAGDTMAAVVTRALACIARVAQRGAVLCVSHCDVIRGLVAHYLGLDADRLFAFDCDPASLTSVALARHGGGRIMTLNERPA